MAKQTAAELRLDRTLKSMNVYIGSTRIFDSSASNTKFGAFLGFKGRVSGSGPARDAFIQHVGRVLSQKFTRFHLSGYSFPWSGILPEEVLSDEIGGGINASRDNYNKPFYSDKLGDKSPIYIGDCDSPKAFYNSKIGRDAAASNGILFVDVSNFTVGRCIRYIPCEGITYVHVKGVKDDPDMAMGFLSLYVLVRIIRRAVMLKKAVLVNCQHGTSRSVQRQNWCSYQCQKV